jgi:ribosomal protein S18 acetylase RimI-like enzyme
VDESRNNAEMPAGLSLRPARTGDRVFLWEVHRDAMREHLEKPWGWNEDEQLQLFLGGLDLRLVQIIRWQRREIGFLTVSETPEEIFLRQISILRVHQGQGIGTAVVRLLLERGAREGTPVALLVFKNSRALRLYTRLGLCVVGETAEHWRMVWTPSAAQRGKSIPPVRRPEPPRLPGL